jgi:probable phosphoglycerate mutase
VIELVLVRHAQPMWEPGGRAVDNPELTELGLQQANRLAEWLSGEHFDAFYCSPLLRCRQTAAPLEALWRRSCTILSWLEEIRLPTLEGQPSAQVHEFLAQVRARDLEDWWEGAPGGESFRHFHERVVGGLEPLLTRDHRAELHSEASYRLWQVPSESERILVVAHGGTIAVMLSFLLGIEPVPWEWERFKVGWCGLSVVRSVELATGALWSLTSFNARGHLAGLPDPWG